MKPTGLHSSKTSKWPVFQSEANVKLPYLVLTAASINSSQNIVHVQSVVHDWILSYFLFSHFHCIYFFGDLLLVTLTPEITATLLIGYCSLVTKLCPTLLPLPWTISNQDPLSMGFPRQEYWSGLPFPSPGDLPDPGIKHAFPTLAGGFFTTEPPGKP